MRTPSPTTSKYYLYTPRLRGGKSTASIFYAKEPFKGPYCSLFMDVWRPHEKGGHVFMYCVF